MGECPVVVCCGVSMMCVALSQFDLRYLVSKAHVVNVRRMTASPLHHQQQSCFKSGCYRKQEA